MRHLVTILLFLPLLSPAQEHMPVFPSLSGDTLLSSLQQEYTPSVVLDYSMARDTLFKNIDSINDTLYGIYTHHGLYLPPDEDPTEAAFKNGAADGINTEHAWPRSKGASDGNAESDMHHLYPSRTPVNADRANLPFGEVPDQQTQKWYFEDQTQNSIPTNNIDAYSELGASAFEPRESVKGDIARSMFYFYTIYRSEALAEDPAFFDIQREDLCVWHLSDPVDGTEWQRTQSIAMYQDGKKNPFILDCTLAKRIYCSEFQDCQPVNSIAANNLRSQLQVYPNPANHRINVSIKGEARHTSATLHILDLCGRIIKSFQVKELNAFQINIQDLSKGIYIVHWRSIENPLHFSFQKLVVQP